jgi:hypothetical protein
MFRWLGAILGSLAAVGAAILLIFTIREALALRQAPNWGQLVIGIGTLAVSIQFWRAAITGHDPYVNKPPEIP